jgi:hypothetical protein
LDSSEWVRPRSIDLSLRRTLGGRASRRRLWDGSDDVAVLQIWEHLQSASKAPPTAELGLFFSSRSFQSSF